MAKRYKYTQARQIGGDDGYQWCVLVKYNGGWRVKVNGLTRSEVSYYRDKFEREEAEKIVPVNPILNK